MTNEMYEAIKNEIINGNFVYCRINDSIMMITNIQQLDSFKDSLWNGLQ